MATSTAGTWTAGDLEKKGQFSKKSGKGTRDGVVSELTTLWDIKPGKEQEVRAAVKRFTEYLQSQPIENTVKTGLRTSRFVVMDSGKRMFWLTSFEDEWEPYIEDAVVVIGLAHFVDWLQHTTSIDRVNDWIREAGGLDTLLAAQGSFLTDRAREKTARASTGGLKDIINSVQFPATGFFDPLGDVTHPQIRKAQKVNEAFQKVLDNPKAGEVLNNPVLKPLLDLASE